MELAATDLAAIRGVRILFSGLSFRVTGGEFLALRGPNGSGKTTLLRILAGLTAPQQGHVVISGADSEDAGNPVQYCGHGNGLKLTETPRKHLRFVADFLGVPKGRVETVMDAAGLIPLKDIPVRALSAGQRRRVALSRLMLSERPVWLLDEPATSLDTAAKAWLSELIETRIRAGGLVLCALHEELPLAPTRVLDLGKPAP